MIFNKNQLKDFLRKLDAELHAKAQIYIIGGAAATLAYNSKEGTKDIDTWQSDAALNEAYERLVKKYPKLKMPFGPALVHIRSNEVLSRFVPYNELDLKLLKIKVPTAEDLFLLKAQRADEKDIDDLSELNITQELDAKIILQRFIKDILPHNYANDQRLIDNYLFCIDKVFGLKVAKEHQRSLRKSP